METHLFLWRASPALGFRVCTLSAERDWGGCTLQSKQAAPPTQQTPHQHQLRTCPVWGKHLAQPEWQAQVVQADEPFVAACWIWASGWHTSATQWPAPGSESQGCGNPVQASSVFKGTETKMYFCFSEHASKKVLIRAS